MLPHVADTEELHNLIMEMIGDMNASHTGITGGEPAAPGGRRTSALHTRYPGFDLEPDASGFYKVGCIYPQGSGRSRLRQDRARQLSSFR